MGTCCKMLVVIRVGLFTAQWLQSKVDEVSSCMHSRLCTGSFAHCAMYWHMREMIHRC
jgi:hypothetical protein